MFSKVLIANRGAIAVRIERTLAKMGVKSVAVYSKADRDSLHVENADEAVYLGEGTAKDTYLDVDKIIKAALDTGAEAIHPGYGFLSENTVFAAKCEENNIKFVGPDSSQIKLFGLKHSAREIAQKANVPLLSGTGLLKGVDEAIAEAEKIGYPVMIKSTAGGGGIGIRICENKDELVASYDNVCHLAESNFNDAGVFLKNISEKQDTLKYRFSVMNTAKLQRSVNVIVRFREETKRLSRNLRHRICLIRFVNKCTQPQRVLQRQAVTEVPVLLNFFMTSLTKSSIFLKSIQDYRLNTV